ncbi:MAG: hypothetical protein KBS82_03300 [Oscillospiraceae bacterium]|nr:hypothetical protein [Candidatus Limimonas egerieequi]
MNFEVEFFEKNGKCPVAEFILWFYKKTQKTPSKQIELAKSYMKEYYSEVKNNEVG